MGSKSKPQPSAGAFYFAPSLGHGERQSLALFAVNGPDERIERTETRLRVLGTALRAFAEATTDYERLLNVIARSVSSVVADGCIVFSSQTAISRPSPFIFLSKRT